MVRTGNCLMKWSSKVWSGIIILAWFLGGCDHKRTVVKDAKGSETDVGGHIQRGKEKEGNQNELLQLGQFYNQYYTENGQPPDLEQLKTYVQKDYPKLYQGLQEGKYVVIKAVPASGIVLAYEKDTDLNGNRLVVMGDRSV